VAVAGGCPLCFSLSGKILAIAGREKSSFFTPAWLSAYLYLPARKVCL
jgi:hypothetical protein